MNQPNFDNFLFRAHYVGELMPPAKGKSNKQKYQDCMDKIDELNAKYFALDEKKRELVSSKKIMDTVIDLSWERDRLESILSEPHLGAGCISRLSQCFTEYTSGREKNIENKYIQKGLAVEEDSITMYSLYSGLMYSKNKERKSNEYVEGEVDFKDDEFVIDTKSTWDIFTFDAKAFNKLDVKYEWQLQTYMWLWNRRKAKLVYTCLDTPEHLIQKEIGRFERDYIGSQTDFNEAVAKIRKRMTYGDLPFNRKIQVYEVDADDTKIDMIKEKVIECRRFLNDFTKIKTNDTED